MTKGGRDTLVPNGSTFTCSRAKLVLTLKQNVKGEAWHKSLETLTYRRV